MVKTRSRKRVARRKSMRGGETPEEVAAREKRMAEYEARQREIDELKSQLAKDKAAATSSTLDASALKRVSGIYKGQADTLGDQHTAATSRLASATNEQARLTEEATKAGELLAKANADVKADKDANIARIAAIPRKAAPPRKSTAGRRRQPRRKTSRRKQ